MTDWTWWESLGTDLAGAANRLCRLMHEGRVRRVQVEKDRQTVAEFPVDGDANEIVFASVIDAAHAAGPACTIRAELADPESAHAAGLQTNVP